MKLNRRTTLAGAAALAAGSLSRAAFAQAYPSKPIRIVVPFAAGLYADRKAEKLFM